MIHYECNKLKFYMQVFWYLTTQPTYIQFTSSLIDNALGIQYSNELSGLINSYPIWWAIISTDATYASDIVIVWHSWVNAIGNNVAWWLSVILIRMNIRLIQQKKKPRQNYKLKHKTREGKRGTWEAAGVFITIPRQVMKWLYLFPIQEAHLTFCIHVNNLFSDFYLGKVNKKVDRQTDIPWPLRLGVFRHDGCLYLTPILVVNIYTMYCVEKKQGTKN